MTVRKIAVIHCEYRECHVTIRTTQASSAAARVEAARAGWYYNPIIEADLCPRHSQKRKLD